MATVSKKAQLAKLRYKYEDADKQTKTKMWLIFALILIAILMLCALLVGGAIGSLYKVAGKEKPNAIIIGLTDGRLATIILFLVIIVVSAYFIFKPDKRDEIADMDERGIYIVKNGASGTSRLMTTPEIKENFDVIDPKDNVEHNTTYGQLTTDGTQIICEKKGLYDLDLKNTLVLGPSGSGKTRGLVMTQVINAVLRGDSFVISDPAGDMYAKLSSFCREHGVDVRAFNLKDTEYSDSWNCLDETIDERTGRIDGKLLNTFVTIYINNVSDTSSGDPFWHEMASGYLKAAIGYVAWKHDTEVIDLLKSLYKKVGYGQENYNEILSCFGDNNQQLIPITWCKRMIIRAAKEKHLNINAIESIISQIEETAYPYTIENVHKCLQNFGVAETEYSQPNLISDLQVGKIAYKQVAIKSLSEQVKASSILGALNKMTLFVDDKLVYNLSHNGIVLKNIRKKQSGYFLIISDTSDKATIPIASLFFSFLLMDAQTLYDYEENKAKDAQVENPLKPLVVILDDFYSLGYVMGKKEEFLTYMADSRKRKIHTTIIIQNIAMLADRYTRDGSDSIQANCNTKIILAAADQNSMNWASELTGHMTVLKESYKEGDSNVSFSSEERNVMLPDEIRTMPKNRMIVIKDNYLPALIYKLDISQNPDYPQDAKITSIYSVIPSYSDKVLSSSKALTNAQIYELIKNIDMSPLEMVIINDDGEVIAQASYDIDRDSKEYKDDMVILSKLTEVKPRYSSTFLDPNVTLENGGQHIVTRAERESLDSLGAELEKIRLLSEELQKEETKEPPKASKSERKVSKKTNKEGNPNTNVGVDATEKVKKIQPSFGKVKKNNETNSALDN